MNNTQDNDTPYEEKKATVSLRNIKLSTWHKLGYKCKTEGITISKYVEQLIEKDLQLGENTGDSE